MPRLRAWDPREDPGVPAELPVRGCAERLGQPRVQAKPVRGGLWAIWLLAGRPLPRMTVWHTDDLDGARPFRAEIVPHPPPVLQIRSRMASRSIMHFCAGQRCAEADVLSPQISWCVHGSGRRVGGVLPRRVDGRLNSGWRSGRHGDSGGLGAGRSPSTQRDHRGIGISDHRCQRCHQQRVCLLAGQSLAKQVLPAGGAGQRTVSADQRM